MALPPQSPYTPQPSCQDVAVTWQTASAERLGSQGPTPQGPGPEDITAGNPRAQREESSPTAAPLLAHHRPSSQGIKRRTAFRAGVELVDDSSVCLCRGLRTPAVQPSGLPRVVLRHLLRIQIPGPTKAP